MELGFSPEAHFDHNFLDLKLAFEARYSSSSERSLGVQDAGCGIIYYYVILNAARRRNVIVIAHVLGLF